MRAASSVRAAALLEAAKGAVVFAAGFGLLSFIHHDAQRVAEQLVTHLHLNPASRYPRIFLDAAGHLTNARLWLFAALAGTYGSVRFVEAYGLWRGRRWAEWLAAVSGSIYIPFEIYELFKRLDWISVGTLAVNVAIVGVMVAALARGRAIATAAADGSAARDGRS